jgi:hypothetical protein
MQITEYVAISRIMPQKENAMLRQIIAVISLLAAVGMAHAGEAARIVFVAGQVHIANHPAALGDAVNEGDEIATGADGYVYMKTIDSGFLILRPNSRAHISSYHVDQQVPANTRVKLELLSGVARSISGLGVKQARQNFRFNTPVAAIGVRGTDFTVFTDQHISRVAVISGGVIVSGFGGACLPEGGGPCEGAASRELFADKAGQLLQIQKGQLTPQLLRSNGISPDLSAPPRSDEPTSKTSSIGNATLAPTDLSLAPQKSSILDNNPNAVGTPPVAPVTPPIQPTQPITPPVVVIPPVVTPLPDSQIVWGRWQPIVDQAAQIDFVAQKAKNALVALDNYYALFLTPGQAYVSPAQGSVGFTLKNSEAYILNDNTAISPTAATLQNGQLNVNFGTKTFTTSMDLVNGTQLFALQAQGSVGSNGYLNGNDAFSRTGYINVAGVLSTENGGAAAYLFHGRIDPTHTVNGATYWGH